MSTYELLPFMQKWDLISFCETACCN